MVSSMQVLVAVEDVVHLVASRNAAVHVAVQEGGMVPSCRCPEGYIEVAKYPRATLLLSAELGEDEMQRTEVGKR